MLITYILALWLIIIIIFTRSEKWRKTVFYVYAIISFGYIIFRDAQSHFYQIYTTKATIEVISSIQDKLKKIQDKPEIPIAEQRCIFDLYKHFMYVLIGMNDIYVRKSWLNAKEKEQYAWAQQIVAEMDQRLENYSASM